MLKPLHLATIRAALQFWAEEMCPHGSEAMRPYLPAETTQVLSAEEVLEVRSLLTTPRIRYVEIAGRAGRMCLKGPTLRYRSISRRTGKSWATVILPTVGR